MSVVETSLAELIQIFLVRLERPPQLGSKSSGVDDKKDSKTPALKAFGRDLTELAKNGELDPVIGRVMRFAGSPDFAAAPRITQCSLEKPVLARPRLSKVLLKKFLCIVEILADKRLITLDLALMVAGKVSWPI